MRYQWPQGKQSAVVLSFDFDARPVNGHGLEISWKA